MSEKAVYIRNVCDLKIPRCVVSPANPRLILDLLPGAFGLASPSFVSEARFEIFKSKNRIEILTDKQYADLVKGEQEPVAPVAKTKVAPAPVKPGPRVLQEGTVSMEAGYDDIPVSNEIPEPTVTNLITEDGSTDKGVVVKAPPGTSPMVDPGDPIKLKPEDLRPRVLQNDGSLVADNFSKTAPAEAIVGGNISRPPTTSEPNALPADVQTTPEVKAEVDKILANSNWRVKKKLLGETTNVEVIKLVREKTTTSKVVEACDERLKELASK